MSNKIELTIVTPGARALKEFLARGAKPQIFRMPDDRMLMTGDLPDCAYRVASVMCTGYEIPVELGKSFAEQMEWVFREVEVLTLEEIPDLTLRALRVFSREFVEEGSPSEALKAAGYEIVLRGYARLLEECEGAPEAAGCDVGDDDIRAGASVYGTIRGGVETPLGVAKKSSGGGAGGAGSQLEEIGEEDEEV